MSKIYIIFMLVFKFNNSIFLNSLTGIFISKLSSISFKSLSLILLIL